MWDFETRSIVANLILDFYLPLRLSITGGVGRAGISLVHRDEQQTVTTQDVNYCACNISAQSIEKCLTIGLRIIFFF